MQRLWRVLVAVIAVEWAANVVGQKDKAQRIMEDFSGYGDQIRAEDMQSSGRELKSGVRLSDIKAGNVDAFGSKKDLITEGVQTAQQIIEGGPEGLLDYKKNLAFSTYDKSRKAVSKILNLLGVPISEDPLQDALDAGIAASAASTVVTADFAQVTSSNLERILKGNKQLKDAYAQSQAEVYKAILRNILLLKQGLGILTKEVEEVADDLCEPATFTPPRRKRAEYRGPGVRLTFKTGECALDFQNEFLDWDFKLFCNKPSLTYVKTPPVFISEHTTPAEFKTRECKVDKVNYGEVEAVLHVFDGASLLNPSTMSNLFFSNTFPRNTQVLRGDLFGLNGNDTVTNILGTLLNWDASALNLGNKKEWGLMSVGKEKSLLGAKNDLSGLFINKIIPSPEWLEKGILT